MIKIITISALTFLLLFFGTKVDIKQVIKSWLEIEPNTIIVENLPTQVKAERPKGEIAPFVINLSPEVKAYAKEESKKYNFEIRE